MRSTPRAALRCALAAGSVLLSAGLLSADARPTVSVSTYDRLPLAFEPNRGQAAPEARFLSRSSSYNLLLGTTGAILVTEAGEAAPLRLRWLNADPRALPVAEDELPGKVHYFLGGDPAGWQRNVPLYERVRYRNLYPGIDLVFYGNRELIEHDYVVRPGADPRSIRLVLDGAGAGMIDAAGDLVMDAGGEEVRMRRPVAYQEVAGARRPVASSYRLLPPDAGGAIRVGFELGPYDREVPLVIDPVLVYSTYFPDVPEAIAVDPAGNTYLSAGFGPAGVQGNAQLTKLDPLGRLVYSLHLGGSGPDRTLDVAADSQGNAYLTGETQSIDFPRVHPLQPPYQGSGSDAFVAKVDPTGSVLLFASNLGGSLDDFPAGIAVDSQGLIYVAGTTRSEDFPTRNALFPDRRGVFVAKIDSAVPRFVYSTYIGGSRGEIGSGIAVDPWGNAIVVGETFSSDFPLVNALQEILGDGGDPFVTKLDPSGQEILFSTYLGGCDSQWISSVATDPAGNIYVAGGKIGEIPWRDPWVPTVCAPDLYRPSAFVLKLSPDGRAPRAQSYSGDNDDWATGVGADSQGHAYVVGSAESLGFPLKDPIYSCEGDVCPRGRAFLVKTDLERSQILFSTFLAGSRGSRGLDVAVDPRGSTYITGTTMSTDFPLVHALQIEPGPGFVAKISFNRLPDCSAAFASPATFWPPNGRLVPVSIQGVTDPDGDPVALAVTGIRQDEPLSRSGVPDATGLGTPGAQVRADRAGKGDGRVYHIGFEARDDKGATCTGMVRVCVPHDQRPDAACGDGGGLFDSTAPGN